jgi:hypothetical protein
VSSLHSIEGGPGPNPFEGTIHGRLNGSSEPPNRGTLRGSADRDRGTVTGDSSDSPVSSAIAEVGALISSLGSLSAQAQGLPLGTPSLPGLPQNQGYRPQTTDYSQFGDDSN